MQEGIATSWLTDVKGGVWWYGREPYGDFILKTEFRITLPGGNSGIFVRCASLDPTASRGYQIDVSEDANPLEMTGAICGVKAPSSVPQNKRDWNALEIRVVGQHYLVKLNGTLVNDFTGNQRASGYIGLQEYKVGGVQFRNLRIKEITAQTLVSDGPGKIPGSPVDREGFTSLFNGRDLSGWDGDTRFWSVKGGVIEGESRTKEVPQDNTFLIWKGGAPRDFELRLAYKITTGNSGVQYRSRMVDPRIWKVSGYQFEMDALKPVNGAVYDEGGHRKALGGNAGGSYLAGVGEKVTMTADDRREVTGKLSPVGLYHAGSWNDLVIIAQGNHFVQKLNGVVVSDLTDDDAQSQVDSGIIALQLHGGVPQKVEFKDIRLKQ